MDDVPGIDDLFEAAKGGDAAAENQLFFQLRARILALVQHKIWSGKKPDTELEKDVEDITTEVCFVILQKYKTAILYRGFMPWVCMIVRNKLVDYIRRRQREKIFARAFPDDECSAPYFSSDWPEPSVEGTIIDNITIYKALARLPDKCKAIIKAILENDKSDSGSAWYTRVSRCRKLFKKFLKEEGYEMH